MCIRYVIEVLFFQGIGCNGIRKHLLLRKTVAHDHRGNTQESGTHIGKYDTLLEIVMKRNLRWLGHVVRAKGILANTILHGKVEGILP